MDSKINIYLIYPDLGELYNPQAHPPLGLLYIASELKKHFNVFLFNFAIDIYAENKLINVLKTYKNKKELVVFAISCVTATYWKCIRLSKFIKEKSIKYNINSKIVIGGVHPSIFPQKTLEDSMADCIIVGEGEYKLKEIIKNWENNKEVKTIEYANRLYSLDSLDFPARELCPDSQIQDKSQIHIKNYYPNGYATTIITSRGCPYSCAFCSKTSVTGGIRYRSPQNIVEELKEIINKYDVHQFKILDDVFTIDKPRIEELHDRIIQEKLEVYFSSILRADSTDRKLLEKMYNMGVRNICIGVESGSPNILKKINKKETIEDIKNCIMWAHEVKLDIKVFLIFGLPGETLETIEETKQFMIDSQPDGYTLSTYTPLPGSDVWDNPSKYNIKFIEDLMKFKEHWFYWEPENTDSGWYFDLPREVKKARGGLLIWLRNKKWRK